MNVHATPQLTAAEEALVDTFVARASDLAGDPVVLSRRDDAVELLKAGLPTRRVEAWHYTDLRRLLSSVPEYDRTAAPEPVAPLLDNSVVLSVLNGRASDEPKLEGLKATPLRPLLTRGEFADRLVAAGSDDTVGAINTALVSDGYSIEIEANAEIAAPIELQNLQAGGQAHSRFPVSIGDHAKVTIVERQTGSGAALVSSVSELEIGEGAEITWLILQEQPDEAVDLGQFKARLGKDAKLVLFIMNAGSKLVRQEVRVDASGEGSEFKLRGVNLLAGSAHCDVTMVLDHSAPATTSTEVIRNVVTDKAHGVFQGQIRVDRIAQKTDARMACNSLLLSDDAEFSTKPELEIFADDVACGHGATVTEIDTGHLFYLMARGIPEKEARGLLVKAFLAEVIEELEDEAIVDALEARLDTWFAEHG